MPMYNLIELSLKWYERCLLTVANTATFKITDAILYVPIVTLSIGDNSKLSKLLNEGFTIYWKKYKVTPKKIVEIATVNEEKYVTELLEIQIVKELKDYLFLLMIIQKVIIKFLVILTKNTFFQELK